MSSEHKNIKKPKDTMRRIRSFQLVCFFTFFVLFFLCSLLQPSFARPAPYIMRISCGVDHDVRTQPTNTLWRKDFAYTGGLPINKSKASYIAPNLSTLRYFPFSEGPNNCYNIDGVPRGLFSLRIFFGLIAEHSFDSEPLFDVSLEGTFIYSLPSGWSAYNDERAFVEAHVFIEDGTASICFHSTGHGDPAILAIEILQLDNMAYYLGPDKNQQTILRTHTRLSCGAQRPKFDVDYKGDVWGGDRFWNSIETFGRYSDHAISTISGIKQASTSPNFYPEALYRTALIGTDNQPELVYTMEVEPNRNYSIWLHFAEIDPSVTRSGQRVFDVSINSKLVFQNVDIVSMAGGIKSALVLNTTATIIGRSLTITVAPRKGSYSIINAIEVFEVIIGEPKTLPDEVIALKNLKSALGLPLRFGWNGDPCAPQQHPWSGVNCQFDRNTSKWFIDGLGLDNQGLRGFLPDDILKLSRLGNINLSGNHISGPIPFSLGNITTLEILDLSINSFNGSIPESLGQLTLLQRLELNSNSLSGRVPAALGGRLLHGASFNFTDNAGLCGIPGLPSCGPHLSVGAKVGIAFMVFAALLLFVTCLTCWWRRRQNILRTKRLAARDAPYAKKRTHFSHDVQMTLHHGPVNGRPAAETAPSLLA